MTIVQFDSPEAAERAAWMLKGDQLSDNRVSVPDYNSDNFTLDSVAVMVGSGWTLVDQSSEAEDKSGEYLRSTLLLCLAPNNPDEVHGSKLTGAGRNF